MSDIAAIFESQKRRRWALSTSGPEERIAKLKRLEEAVIDRSAALCEAIGRDFGKSPVETKITEIYPVVAEIRHTIRHLRKWMRPVRVPSPLILFGTRAEYRHEAKGVVLILSPWNYPFNLLVAPLVSAIAAGNAVMLKPSSKVPATSAFLRDFLSGLFPEDEVAVVEGDSSVSDALLELPFDHVFFTGSPAVGRKVMAAAARNLAPVTLELGGKSPVIVDESADPRLAAERVMWAKFVNGGQTCVAPDYLLIHERILPRFLAEARRVLELRFGTSADERRASPDLCRLVSPEQVDRITSGLAEAVSRGARLEFGGSVDRASRYVEPTILSDISPDTTIMREEIFGPILPILGFRDLSETIDFIRARPKPLALYLFSGNEAVVERVLGETSAGGTAINSLVLHFANTNLPFGGVGMSGMGNYHGRFGFETFSHQRAVLRQGRLDLLSLFYPPYSRRVENLVDWAIRRLP